tara:strand:+ start:452 stop:796 length:345 start_codon:yes stop_codon:yes gene_type:complete
MLSLLLLLACGETQPEPYPLTREYYKWTCKDYQDHSEIIVTSETCDDVDTGLWYLIAETHLYNGTNYKRHLTQEVECYYETNFVLIDDVCISVEGVTLTAWIDPPTWSGALSGD